MSDAAVLPTGHDRATRPDAAPARLGFNWTTSNMEIEVSISPR